MPDTLLMDLRAGDPNTAMAADSSPREPARAAHKD
jgi:hypothetical protein